MRTLMAERFFTPHPNPDSGKEEVDETGDPDTIPGEGAEREIQPNFLVPFNFGWQREVVFRQARGAIILLGISSSS